VTHAAADVVGALYRFLPGPLKNRNFMGLLGENIEMHTEKSQALAGYLMPKSTVTVGRELAPTANPLLLHQMTFQI